MTSTTRTLAAAGDDGANCWLGETCLALLTLLKAPLLPFLTAISDLVKPVTASEKVNVKVTSPLAVPGTLSAMVSLGFLLSRIRRRVLEAGARLPAASATRAVKEWARLVARLVLGVKDQVLALTVALPRKALPE